MPGTQRRNFLGLVSAAVVVAAAGLTTFAAHAQNNRPVRLVIAGTAGGPLDFFARLAQPYIEKETGRTVIIDSKPGAGGVVGLMDTLQAGPDSNSITIIGSNFHTIPLLQAVPYKLTDFEPVSRLAVFPITFSVAADSPWKDFKSMVADVKANPGKYKYVSYAIGSMQHLPMEYLKLKEGLDSGVVLYRGAPQAYQDLFANRVQINLMTTTEVVEPAAAGKIRNLAVISPERIEIMPDVPSIVELGYPELGSFIGSFNALAPKGTSKELIAGLVKAFKATVADAGNRGKLKAAGIVPVASTSEEYGKAIETETKLFSDVVQKAGIKGESAK